MFSRSPVDVAHFSKIEGSIQKEYGELHNISSDSFLQILKPENVEEYTCTVTLTNKVCLFLNQLLQK